ncbi:CTP--2,3-di-O-geranylgeranyl-sn-glycero-1-phosphate cytidyltransferase [Candidatus Woesearchaeota archaeon]|nr:CTP--2,3-di-O-geranylgeranyl-sn-glycero-1-phosphate cytidyltransferase [Candidatus Woesearchaeota archaeon]
MAWNYKKEVGRKAIHLFSLLFIFIYIIGAWLFGHRASLIILGVILTILIEMEYLRIEAKYKIPLLSKLWKYKRAKEKHRLGGEVFFLIGVIICLALLDFRIAVAAILMTTFGDLAAALIGRLGRIKILSFKTLEGILAELIIDLFIGFLFVRELINGQVGWLSGNFTSAPIWPVIIVMAFTATIVETLVFKIDDNLLIPLFSGINGQIAMLVLNLVLVFI